MYQTLKLNKLKAILQRYSGVVVAFSGGVDSGLLLKVAKETLKEKVIAVTASSPLYPESEIKIAKKIAHKLKVKHLIIYINELNNSQFVTNPKDRCFYCKTELFETLNKIAKKYGYVVIEGSNESDLSDYRPGLIAIQRLDIKSPLLETGLKKEEIRNLAKRFKLPNWNKPSMACLASRIPYGRIINRKTLKRIAFAESYLKKLELTQIRVRDYYPIARIEVLEDEIEKVLKHRRCITKFFRKIGYKYVTVDLEGYQTGSLNR